MMYESYCTYCNSSANPNYEISNINYNSTPIEPIIDSKQKPIRHSKHIPHHLRPQHVVERRNTRERRRVQDVNQAFLLLKSLLPFDINNDQLNSTRISKVRTLRKAVDYIEALQNMLNETN